MPTPLQDLVFGRRMGFSGTPSDLIPVEFGKCCFEEGDDGKVIHTLTSPAIVNYEVHALILKGGGCGEGVGCGEGWRWGVREWKVSQSRSPCQPLLITRWACKTCRKGGSGTK